MQSESERLRAAASDKEMIERQHKVIDFLVGAAFIFAISAFGTALTFGVAYLTGW